MGAAEFFNIVTSRAIELLVAPARNFDMVWFAIPLAVVTLMMTFYFARYTLEELGWNTALGNSLVLIFVSIDLLRYIFHFSDPGSFVNYLTNIPRTAIVLAIAIEGILLMYTNFLHFLPKRLAFFVSSPLPVNLQAYTVMALVYTEVPIEWNTLWAAVLIFVVLYAVLTMIKQFLSWQAERVAEIRKHEDKELRLKKKAEKQALTKPKPKKRRRRK